MEASSSRMSVLCSLALALAVVIGSPAAAGHYGFIDGHPNDTAHTMWWTNTLTTPWVNVVNWNRTTNIEPTIFSTLWVPAHGEGADTVDLSIWNASLSSAFGETVCITTSPIDANMCLHYHVRFDHLDPLTYDQQRTIGCHELGHTLGLAHRGDSEPTCMMTKVPVPTKMWFDDPSPLVGHDEGEINRHDPPGWNDNTPPSHEF